MAHIDIPDSLLAEIEKAIPATGSVGEFVVKAVREKLFRESRRQEFYRLSDATRAAMQASGATEANILADFKAFRETIAVAKRRGQELATGRVEGILAEEVFRRLDEELEETGSF